MLAKNIVGIIILVLNIAGLGYMIYMAGLFLVNRFIPKEEVEEEVVTEAPVRKNEKVVIDEDIIPEEDDLLKDMDLSDLDNLNLDDFE
ncbi:MAG: hypothetical protein HUN04_03145 [Desulfobacter sp.]|nr:MAG: hypothetical protein HUN04_03145 [Desulfobacter sp.]